VADAGDRAQVDALVAQARQAAGPLFGLVNVVGGLPRERWEPLLRYSDETLDALLDANLRCAFLTSQRVARELARQGAGGSIVQIASVAALQGMPFGAGYAAAKAALLSLMRTMALEWGPLGIRVNAVAPGTIRVPRSPADDPALDRATLPLGRRGAPSDVAGAVLFLLSDLAQWVTGQVLAVDGGASIKPCYLDESGLPVFVSDPELRARLLE
jgi:NAD(P)-dependent dehydrogenase (short-subunit alcohol dehydrogenase family)